MPAFNPEIILRELLGWTTLLVTVGGGLVALFFMRLSAWMFLVAAGFALLTIQNLLTRFVILFSAHLNQAQNVQGIFIVLNIIGTLAWVAMVAGLFAVFRDVAQQLRFHEEREQARAGATGAR